MSLLAKVLVSISFLAAAASVSMAADKSTKTETRPTGTFQVQVTDDDRLSLNADGAPLTQILREIARQARITIDSNIDPGEKITTRLDRVPLEDGVKRLARNVSVFYAQDSETHRRRIARIVVLAEGKPVTGGIKTAAPQEKPKEPSTQPAKENKPQQRPEPFKFQFDPTKSPGTGQKQP
jgi:biopolymer transport protein ExbD